MEEKAISLVRRPLYEALIQGYTSKQWQTDPKELLAHISEQLPLRLTFKSRYFNDRFEGIQLDGYRAMLTRMFWTDPKIRVILNADYFELESRSERTLWLCTRWYDRWIFQLLLWWAFLAHAQFERDVLSVDDLRGHSDQLGRQRNPLRPIHEFRHLHPERTYTTEKSVIFREYSRFAGSKDEPYYPIGTRGDRKIYQAYSNLAEAEKRTIFGGRLGTYRYLDMHQAIGSALKTGSMNVITPHFKQGRPITGELASSKAIACQILAPSIGKFSARALSDVRFGG